MVVLSKAEVARVYLDCSSLVSLAPLRGVSFEEEEEEGDGSENEVVSGVSRPVVVEGKGVNEDEDEIRSESPQTTNEGKRFTS